jgi:AcrR family transcriptional regulator
MARISAATKESVRARLLETAARHFARDGLEGANVDAISLDAGFAKGTLYNYFRSKEELFAEVLTEGCRRAVRRYSDAEPRGSVRERLRALAAADVTVLREDEGFQKVLIREVMSFRKETYPLIVGHLAPFMEKVEEILAEGVAVAEARNDRPLRELALLFVGILALLYVQHWGSGGSWPDLEEIPELAVMTFLDGAAHRPRSAGAR